jgi:hypothetical protein
MSMLWEQCQFNHFEIYEVFTLYSTQMKHHFPDGFRFCKTDAEVSSIECDPCCRVNVENYLNTAISKKILLRIKPREYKFSKEFINKQYDYQGNKAISNCRETRVE